MKSAFALGVLLASCASVSSNDFDLVLRHGTIVDGSGGRPYAGDVAVRGDRIVAVGYVSGRGRTEICSRLSVPIGARRR